jgi:SAM-dependent methyltransferase
MYSLQNFMKDDKIKQFVKERYSRIARDNTDCCSSCYSNNLDITEQAKRIGYSKKELERIPEEAVLGLGCGNPTALAELKEGERVLDLGAGAGIDVFLAANRVGPQGIVIGVDMTEEMVNKAKKVAEKYGYTNVEFRLGEIEKIPVDDTSMDVIISNCVINLSPDKLKTFREAYRVLKPGGRILISDLVTEEALPEEIKRNFDAWAACVSGALVKQEYIETIKKAGFNNVHTVQENTYFEPKLDIGLRGKITSIRVKAYK